VINGGRRDTFRTAERSPYAGKQVLILGLARQGSALTRFLLDLGAHVTGSDMRTAEDLAQTIAGLNAFAEGRPGTLQVALGGHPLGLIDGKDLVCLSGGVSPALPIVEEAVRRGISLSNDGALTLRHCPVPVIGITGSAGKTTTTTLVGLILEASGYTTHVGGNIGRPLIDRLSEIRSGDKVVMELSSFQLELFDRSPQVAALLNITPNHLDRHPSMSHYAAAKANILRSQTRSDTSVLSADDAYTGPWLENGRCEIPAGEGQQAVYFPLQAQPLAFSLQHKVRAGAFLADDRLVYRGLGDGDAVICEARDVRLRGRHNLGNILAAACIAGAAGATIDAMRQVATSFGGVEHRLEIVRQRSGVMWVNDSIATAPERTIAALRSFNEPLVLLLGGRDKHLPWDECAAELNAGNVRHVILFGEASGLIAEALAQHAEQVGLPGVPVTVRPGLTDAVITAEQVAEAGDVVLLAPGCTSFDAYPDFAARGQHFRTLVEALP
jgi:UDP-N-acetylmuramoylalanine--D-glutamate ligase